MSLKQKTLKGLGWSFASQGTKQVSQFIITAILARLLPPSDFGLIAMAAVFTGFVMVINEMGVSGALIQNQSVDDRHYSSVFWLNMAVGILMMIVMMVVSSPIADFYNKPELGPILMLLSVNFVIASFSIVQQTLFQKEMDFKRLAFAETLSVIIGGCVGIYAALSGKGVWSLAYQLLALTSSTMVCLWLLSSWKPTLFLSVTALKDIYHFSANVTGFNIVNYFARNVDYLLIGKFLGAEALGYYSLAYRIMLYPLQNVSWVLGKVLLPAFSKAQNEMRKVHQHYLQLVKAISLITFPILSGMFVFAPDFVTLFFGVKWSPSIILIQVFCFCGMFQSINTTAGIIILSQGNSQLQLRLGIQGALVVTLAIISGLFYGPIGVCLAYTAFYFVWAIYVQNKVNFIVGIKLKDFLRQISLGLIIAMVILVSSLILRSVFGVRHEISRFGIIALIIGAFYVALLFFTKVLLYESKKLQISL